MRSDFNRALIKFTVFVLPLLFALCYSEYRLRGIPNSYNLKRIYFEQQLGSIEVLVLGNSQSLYGVNPCYFSCKGFNLSNISQSIYYDYKLVARYIDKMPRLKYAFVSISYFTLFYELEGTKESWREYYYYHFWDIGRPQLPCLDLRRYSYIALYNPSQVVKYAKKGFNVNLAGALTRNGFYLNDNSETDLKINDKQGQSRVRQHKQLMRLEVMQRVADELKSLVSLFAEKKIRVAFITTPVYQTYYKFCDKTAIEQSRMLIGAICKEYGPMYYDYSTDVRFGREDFADNDHMSVDGAAKFSRILNEEALAHLVEDGSTSNVLLPPEIPGAPMRFGTFQTSASVENAV